MIPAPLPANESARLSDLQALQLLDTPAEERFDSIVRLAMQLFDVPIAYVALIDGERQWFKARCGLAVTETLRDISFCGHAILHDHLTVVPDAQLDQRFQGNPLVTGEPFIRFYAGHPLKGARGYNVGTLCIADRVSRDFGEQQQHWMVGLAELTQSQLRLTRLAEMQRELLTTQSELLVTRAQLDAELQEAADYVCSLLPEELREGGVRTDWTYESCSQLGGDLFGYHWLNEDQFVVYLLDVCGHGVGACLLASSVHSVLRRRALPDCDFSDPDAVLSALDAAFPMEEHHDKFFTIWYGVYTASSRTLKFAAAGHHPSVLWTPGCREPVELGQSGLMIGVATDRQPQAQSQQIPAGSRLHLFSDGAFETRTSDGQMLGREGLNVILLESGDVPEQRTRHVWQRLKDWMDGESFTDDFSLVELEFGD